MTQAQQVLDYLWAVAPSGATNARLAEAWGIASQQPVYMLTRELAARGWVRDERQGRTPVFFAQEGPLLGSEPGAPPLVSDLRAAAHFAAFAGGALSARYGADLAPRTIPSIRKRFTLVSSDYKASWSRRAKSARCQWMEVRDYISYRSRRWTPGVSRHRWSHKTQGWTRCTAMEP